MIKPDYDNGQLLVVRGGKTIHTFKFVELCTARQFQEVGLLRDKLLLIASGKKKVTDKEAKQVELEFYNVVTSKGLANALPYEEALDTLTPAEMGSLSEEIYIFLINWYSIEEVILFASQLAETKKKETTVSESSQKSTSKSK